MKALIKIQCTLAIMLSLSAITFAQQHNMHHQKNDQMTEMMADSASRNMMMKHIAQNPEMRVQMMQYMRNSMPVGMDKMMGHMHQMMNSPEMKERMKKHLEMMQSMMEGDQMNHSKMMEMMQDSSMMKMHMMCMQMMHSDVMGNSPGMMKKDDRDSTEQ